MSQSNIVPASTSLPQEVRKHISAVHISGDLTAVERKLINVMLRNAFDELSTKTEFSLPVAVMCDMIGWEESNNVTSLKESLRRITRTSVEFDVLHDKERDKKRQKWQISAPIAAATIEDGICTYEYSKVMRDALANPEVYAVINLNVQKEFTGAYSLALYENCVRFRGTRSTGFILVDIWKKLLGVGINSDGKRVASAYDQFKHFNNQVIQKAVKEINTVSDIYITPEYLRTGRKVTAIKFTVEPAAQGSLTLVEPDQDEIRGSDTYKLLREIGVSDRLAVDWVSTDPERAYQTAKIVSVKMKKKQINKNPAGYASTLFKGDSDLSVTLDADKQAESATVAAREIADAAKAKEKEVNEADERTRMTDAAVAALTADETAGLLAEYVEQSGAKTYDAQQGRFRAIGEQVAYRTFTRQHAANVVASRVTP